MSRIFYIDVPLYEVWGSTVLYPPVRIDLDKDLILFKSMVIFGGKEGDDPIP